jgi:hypothetical protein
MQKETKCDYCGSTVIVPEELRDKPEPVTFSYDSFYKDFNTAIPTINKDISKSIGTAAKVTAGVSLGVTAVSIIVPLVITCMILGFVGFILFSTFSSVNKTIAAIPTSMFSAPTTAPTSIPQTPTPAFTPTPINTPVPYSKVLLKDNFAKSSSGWSKIKNSDYTLEYKNGKYHVLINKQNGGQVTWIGDKYTDVSVEVDVEQTAGPGDSEVGVVCRPTDSGGFYSFEFNLNGEYGIYKSTDWNSEPLAQGTLEPNTLSANTVNHLEGICDGSNLTLLLNGKALLQAQDSEYTKGGVGLVVTAGSSGDAGADVLFSNFLSKGPQIK